MNKLKINFQIKYIVLFLFFIFAGGLIIFLTMNKYNVPFTFTDIMAYGAGSVAIMALIYHALSLEFQHKFHQDNLFLTRSQYAYEVISKFNEPHMSDSLLFLNKLEDNINDYFPDKKVQTYLDYIKNNPEDRQKIIMIINYFEHLSILIKNNHIEESIVKNNFKTIFVDTFILMKPYIDHCQQHSSSIWCNYEKLAIKWNS